MKGRWFRVLVGAGVLLLVLALSAGSTVSAGSRLIQTPPPDPSGVVLGDYVWSPLGGPSVTGGQVLGLAVPPTFPGTVYAAVSAPGGPMAGPSTIFKSTDGAASWAPVYQTAQWTVNCLAANGLNVFAGANQGSEQGPTVYASNDGGATWFTPFDFGHRGWFADVAIDPGNADLAIMGGSHQPGNWEIGVVYGTQDGGLTWDLLLEAPVPDQHTAVMAVLISPHNPDLMLASLRGNGPDDTRIYRSTDGGAAWTDVATIAGAHVTSFLAHPANSQVIYAGAGAPPYGWGPSRVYRSGDAGLTWDLVLPDAGGPLAFETPGTVYTVSGGQVWASSTSGDPGTWNQVGNLWDGAARLGIDVDTSPATLYAGLSASGVAVSADGGVDWQGANNGITSLAAPRDIDVDPLNPDKLFVAAERGTGGFRSEDGGASWTPIPLGGPLTFEIQPDDPDVVYAGSSGCNSPTIWRSEDGGLTFTGVYTPTWFQPDCSGGNEQLLAVEAAPSGPQWVYAVGEAQIPGQDRQGAVVRSQDGGLTWSQVFLGPVGSGLQTVAVSALDDQVAWAGGFDYSGGPQAGVIYRTQDGGGTWDQVFLDTSGGVRSLASDSVDPEVLYAGLDSYNIYKSVNGGDAWDLIRPCCPSGNKVVIDPLDHNRIYLGGWGYIAESPDGGATWSEWNAPINQGTPPMEPFVLVANSARPVQTLYAGFSGVWAHTRPAPASGDRYVATTGDDYMNTCTDPANPCQTVRYALGAANPGETIRVAAGTYRENVEITKDFEVLGGYSGAPNWTRDPALYVTVLDGSAIPAVPGDWDGGSVYGPTVLRNGSQYEMWYSGNGIWGPTLLGRATGGPTAWTKSAENPLLEGSEAFVRLEGSLYRAWYNRPDGRCLGYAWSNDGLAWSQDPDPVLCGLGDGSWDADAVSDPSIVVDGGGTYWMFYEGLNNNAPQQVQIGCATSADGLAWTRCAENPVLSPGPNAWEENWVLDPAVLLDDGAFRMWYGGRANDGRRSIGYATSPDGVTWSRYAGNPVLQSSPGTWDDGGVHNHAVWFDGADYHLWYSASERIGHATSADGLSWGKDPGPVLGPGYYGEKGAPVVNVYTPGQGVLGQMPGSVARRIAPQRQALTQVLLDGLTITGGVFWYGAGVSVDQADVTLEGVTVMGNQALGDGGGIYATNGSTLTILNSEITNNTAQNWGGGLVAGGGGTTVTMQEVMVTGNRAVGGEGGGLMFRDAGTTANLTNVAVLDNQANGGGGISLTGQPGPLLVMNTVAISRNTARWAAGLRPYQSTVIGDRVWMVDNVATEDGGGGFNADSSDVSLTNAWIVGNAGNAGFSNGGSLTLTNVTVSGNTRGDNMGGLSVGGGGAAAVRNSILFYNGDDDLSCDPSATCSVEYSDLEHPWAGAGNISLDPQFVDRTVGDYHILDYSPCIDQASLTGAPDHDIDGEMRPFDGDGDGLALPDMGADEWHARFIYLPVILRVH